MNTEYENYIKIKAILVFKQSNLNSIQRLVEFEIKLNRNTNMEIFSKMKFQEEYCCEFSEHMAKIPQKKIHSKMIQHLK